MQGKRVYPMIALIAMAGIGMRAHAQHTHPDPMHGGIVAVAGDQYIEIKLTGEELHFYLLDSTGMEMPSNGIIGTAYLQFTDRTSVNVEIRPRKDGILCATLPKPMAFTVVGSLMVDGRFVSARFESGQRDGMPMDKPVPQGVGDEQKH